MTEIKLTRRIEDASLNAWPALNVLHYDGWLLRFANGYSKRANSINVLYEGSLAIEEKIDFCESIYKRQKLETVFRLTPLATPSNLDHHLATRNYKLIDRTSVQLLDLTELEPASSKRAFILPGRGGIESWLRSFHQLNPVRKDAETHKQMLYRIVSKICPLVLMVGGEVVACGLGVLEGEYLGLFDIVTAKEQRRKGLGAEITRSLLAWGCDMGARYAYLQVMEENTPANRLYAGLGFQEIYRYWYRVPSGGTYE
jgi:GNAT superfamily N-acetyltransferase